MSDSLIQQNSHARHIIQPVPPIIPPPVAINAMRTMTATPMAIKVKVGRLFCPKTPGLRIQLWASFPRPVGGLFRWPAVVQPPVARITRGTRTSNCRARPEPLQELGDLIRQTQRPPLQISHVSVS